MKISRVRAKLDDSLADFKDFLNIIDTSGYCEYMFISAADLQSNCCFLYHIIECHTIYNGLLPVGFNSVVINALSYIKKASGVFLREYKNVNSTYAKNELKSVELVKMSKLEIIHAQIR